MAIAFRAAASSTNAGSTTIVVNKPTGTLSGDVLVALLYVDTTGVVSTPPTGWVQRDTLANGTNSFRAYIYTLVCGGSEPSTYTWTLDTTQYNEGVILGFSGVDTTTPVDGHSIVDRGGTGSIVTPTITTTAASDVLVALLIQWGGNAGASAQNSYTLPTNGQPSGGDSWAEYKLGATAGSNGGDTAALIALQPVQSGGGGAPPSAAPGQPRGQGMSAPWRTTQRVPLSFYAHNAFTGISESDAALAAREQFYGDGSQLAFPLRPVYGQWPAAAFAGMGRTSLLWRTHNSGTGVAENDLNSVPTGIASEFYSVLWQTGIIPSGAITFASNSALAESAQVVEPVAPLVGTSVLAESAQVVAPATLQANSALVESAAQVLAPATVQSNSALVESAAQVLAPATIQSNSLLAESVQIVEPLAPIQANSLLAESVQVVEAAAANVQANSALALPTAQVVDPSIPVVSNSLLSVTGGLAGQGGGTIISNSLLAESAQILAPATVQATSVLTETAAQISAPVALASTSSLAQSAGQLRTLATVQANSVLSVTGSSIAGGGGPTLGPVTATVSDAPVTLATVSDALVCVASVSDVLAVVATVSDAPVTVATVSDALVATAVLADTLF